MMDHYFTTESNVDFVRLSEEVNILRCGAKVCHNVTIIDDTQIEPDEVFRITLERTADLEGNVRINRDRSNAEIHIHNTDGRFNM